LKMEPTQCSETSAFNTQTPGKYPEENLSLLIVVQDATVMTCTQRGKCQVSHVLGIKLLYLSA
jgi:hypothetical protein